MTSGNYLEFEFMNAPENSSSAETPKTKLKTKLTQENADAADVTVAAKQRLTHLWSQRGIAENVGG